MKAKRQTDDAPITRERLERARNYVAAVMVRLELPQLAPILELLQSELAKFEAGEDPIGRAKKILALAGK